MISRPLFTSSGIHFIWLSLGMTVACFFSPIASAQIPVSVEITGINQTLETNVRLLLSIEQQKDHPLITVGRLQRLHQKAIQEIATALQPFGYYLPLVYPNLVKSDDGEWL
jgi:translocation and assembly module TamA